jgi:hypothetical protein
MKTLVVCRHRVQDDQKDVGRTSRRKSPRILAPRLLQVRAQEIDRQDRRHGRDDRKAQSGQSR